MAKDVQDTIRELLTHAVDEATKSFSTSGNGNSGPLFGGRGGKSGGPLSGAKGIAAGAGAVALAPLAAKGVGKLAKTLAMDGLHGVTKSPGDAIGGLTSKLGDSVGSGIGDKITDKIDQSGGPGGIVKDAVKGALPFGGDGDDDDDDQKGGVPGVGKGRRMPVQQSVDIGIPLETVYNQWIQFEDWPNFMHRVTRVSQEDDTHVKFATKIWGKTKEFTAEIETQRPDERIKWHVTEGITHTGVVTFHELAPRLTRVELSLDVEPGGMLEKLARGARHIKRAVRGDLHRFKAFIEMLEKETGAWRGRIEDGEVVEEHDPSYDRKHDYADLEDLYSHNGHHDDDEEQSESRRESSGRSQSKSSSRSSGSRSSGGSSGGNSRSSRASSGGNSRSARASSGSSRSRSSSRSSGSRASSGESSRSGGSSSRSSKGGTGGSRKSGTTRARSGTSNRRNGRS